MAQKKAKLSAAEIVEATVRIRDRGSTVVMVLCYSGTAVAQWLWCCATVGPR